MLDRKNKLDNLILEVMNAQDTVTHYNVTNQRELLDDAKNKRGVAVAELQEYVNGLWEEVELTDGQPVVFVGVHALAWQSEWDRPKVGFVRHSDREE